MGKILIGFVIVFCILVWQIPQFVLGVAIGAALAMLAAAMAGWIKDE